MAGAFGVGRHDVAFRRDDVAFNDPVPTFYNAVGDGTVCRLAGVAEDVQVWDAADRFRRVPTTGNVILRQMFNSARPVSELVLHLYCGQLVPAPLLRFHRLLDYTTAGYNVWYKPSFKVKDACADFDEVSGGLRFWELEVVDGDAERVRHQIPSQAKELDQLFTLFDGRLADERRVRKLPFGQLESAEGHRRLHIFDVLPVFFRRVLSAAAVVDVKSTSDGVDDVFVEHVGDLVGVVAEDVGGDGG